MLRRIGVLASLAVVAAMFAGVSSAQAQTDGTCVFSGLAGTLTPGIEDASADTSGNDIERGSYNFETVGVGGAVEGVCSGTFNGVQQTRTDVVITSNGFYDNIVCGTGWAHDLDGDGTLVWSDGPLVGDASDDLAIGVGTSPNNVTYSDPAGYEIAFSGGNGALTIGPDGAAPTAAQSELLPPDTDDAGATNGSHGTDGAGGGMHGTIVSNYTGSGEIHITPAGDDNCVDSPDDRTTAFEVAGHFSATNR